MQEAKMQKTQREQKIVPHLWLNQDAEAAAALYTSLLPNSAILHRSHYTKIGQEMHGQKPGNLMNVDLTIDGYRMSFLNGGPAFKPTPAISYYLVLDDKSQMEPIWRALSNGGQVMMPLDAYPWSPQYGWLNDRFGVSWQLGLGKTEDIGHQRLAPCLMFVGERAGQAEAALRFYSEVFPDSEVDGVLHHDGNGVDPAGTVMHAQCRLGGETFMLMDSALPHAFDFSNGNSQMVLCSTQDEVDYYWQRLSAIPEAESCGWLQDRFGVSWQIVPQGLLEMVADPDPERAERVIAAFMPMKKLDLAAIEKAWRGNR
jgi:predicted 3-demethylubiquinone-9 3-methyltransferase (glyoxalase superfamily)